MATTRSSRLLRAAPVVAVLTIGSACGATTSSTSTADGPAVTVVSAPVQGALIDAAKGRLLGGIAWLSDGQIVVGLDPNPLGTTHSKPVEALVVDPVTRAASSMPLTTDSACTAASLTGFTARDSQTFSATEICEVQEGEPPSNFLSRVIVGDTKTLRQEEFGPTLGVSVGDVSWFSAGDRALTDDANAAPCFGLLELDRSGVRPTAHAVPSVSALASGPCQQHQGAARLPAVRADGGYVYLLIKPGQESAIDPGEQVVAVDPSGSAKVLMDDVHGAAALAVSPHDGSVAFIGRIGSLPRSLCVYSGGVVRAVTADHIDDIAWSPDGAQLATLVQLGSSNGFSQYHQLEVFKLVS